MQCGVCVIFMHEFHAACCSLSLPPSLHISLFVALLLEVESVPSAHICRIIAKSWFFIHQKIKNKRQQQQEDSHTHRGARTYTNAYSHTFWLVLIFALGIISMLLKRHFVLCCFSLVLVVLIVVVWFASLCSPWPASVCHLPPLHYSLCLFHSLTSLYRYWQFYCVRFLLFLSFFVCCFFSSFFFVLSTASTVPFA